MIIPNEQIAQLLNIILIENRFIFINFWTFVHFVSGFLLMMIMFKMKKPKMITFLGLLVLYELFELIVIRSGSTFFQAEPFIDAVWDLIAGYLGGILYLKSK